MADPSATKYGTVSGYTSRSGINIAIPENPTVKQLLLTPFEAYAQSVLVELQRVLARLRSQHLFTSGVDAADGWHLSKMKVRIIGEVWAYGELDFLRIGDDITVPDDGNLESVVLGTLTDTTLVPISLARLMSVNISAMCSGYALNNGDVKLAAMATGADIASGDTITLAGMWPLATAYDSESD